MVDCGEFGIGHASVSGFVGYESSHNDIYICIIYICESHVKKTKVAAASPYFFVCLLIPTAEPMG